MSHSSKMIHTITEILEEDPRVHAAWLEGSIARGEEDDFSDIDLWICVRDADFEQFVNEREQFAAKLGTVVNVLYPKAIQESDDLDSFRIALEELPSTQCIDVDVQRKSRKFSFTRDSAAEECTVLFDRGRVITFKPLQPQEIDLYVEELFEDIVQRFWHNIPKIQALIEREDLLEATDHYLDRLEELITLYRMVANPEKVDWGWKDIEYDLDEQIVKGLYGLYPRLHAKSLRKQLKELTKKFYKQSKVISKHIDKELPSALIHYIQEEL